MLECIVQMICKLEQRSQKETPVFEQECNTTRIKEIGWQDYNNFVSVQKSVKDAYNIFLKTN